MPGRADISLLFDLFVTTQRVRRVLSDGMARSGMRPDQYAVYSLLFDMGPLTATEMAELLGMPLTTVLDYSRRWAQMVTLSERLIPATAARCSCGSLGQV